MAFFDHLEIFLVILFKSHSRNQVFLLKQNFFEILASTIKKVCETSINVLLRKEDLGHQSLICLILSPQFRPDNKLLFDRHYSKCFPNIFQSSF